VLIDGCDLKHLPLADVRRQISVVWQDAGLIRGSLWDNLTLGIEFPSEGLTERIVDLCCLSDLVNSLPDKYATTVGEKGATLSAGQRQRVAIARALIRRAPILLLDEATSHIDTETEARIIAGIFREFPNTTIIFVGHRLSVLPLAHSVFVIDAGRVTHSGTHDQLMIASERYRNMYAPPDAEYSVTSLDNDGKPGSYSARAGGDTLGA
jgi:ATP-binding cassette, subfamily B, bacterial